MSTGKSINRTRYKYETFLMFSNTPPQKVFANIPCQKVFVDIKMGIIDIEDCKRRSTEGGKG